MYINSGVPIVQGTKVYNLSPLLLLGFVGLRYRCHSSLARAAIAPCGITGKPVREHSTGGGKFIPDEAQTQQPAAHGVALVIALQGLVLGRASMQRTVVHRQAKLHVSFQLPGMQAALFARRSVRVEVVELEQPELYPLALKEAVQVQGIMLSST